MNSLRIGFILSGESVPAWVASMLEKTRAVPEAEIVALFVIPREIKPGNLAHSYFSLDRRFFHPGSSPWEPITQPKLPVLRGKADELLLQIGSLRLDLLINLALENIPEGLVSASRLGVWSVRDGRSRIVMGSQPGWQQLLHGELLTICEVEAVRAGHPPRILSQAVLATDPLSVSRNQARLLWRAAGIVPRALRELSVRGEEVFLATGRAAAPATAGSSPGLLEMALLTPKQALRKALDNLRKKLFFEQWTLMTASRAGDAHLRWEGFKRIAPLRGRSWADPFPVERDGRLYIFVEEYPRVTKRGYIACLTLDQKGKVHSSTWVLQRPYHLSYPFVFEYQGEWYMIPETGGNRAVELYHSTHFPDRWEFKKTLLHDVHAVDATLVEHGGLWWLFANVAEEPGTSAWDSLHLFHAEDPLSEDWTPHPLNPVIQDVRSARPAGRIFLRDGMLCRPSQVSVPRYGYALRLNRIDTLTKTDYAETCLETLVPPRGRNILATHTYNSAGGETVIDVQSRRLRLPWP